MFCDLVGSTDRQARLGDDANDAFRRDLFAVLRAAVVAAGGEVVKTIGDAVMAAFRTSAVDALTCAALMHRAVQDLDAEHRVRLRVGVSAGEAAEEDGDWFGMPVVEAARLEAIAQPDQTLVADVVRVLVGNRGGFELRPLGERQLKGLPAATAVAEAICDELTPTVSAALERLRKETDGRRSRGGVVTVTPSFPVRLAVAASAALAGRKDELQVMLDAWDRACDAAIERPRDVVVVCGEPGIGKTRLVAEVARTVAGAGGHVHYGRADEHSEAPFHPWLSVFDALTAETPTEVLQAMRDDVGALERLCQQVTERIDVGPARGGDLETERLRLFRAVERVLVAASDRSPTLVVLDDLHWADRSSLLLLRHLASVDVNGRFLVVATYRDTELDRTHPLAAVLAELRRLRRLQRVAIRGLDRDATAGLITSHAGAEPDTALADVLFAETEGHPFFIEEVCAYLTETGNARIEGGLLIATDDLRRVGVPEGVREVLGRRFERLSTEAIEALHLAAVIGPVFDIRILEELQDGDVVAAIEEAVAARLLRERDDRFGSYEFSHALVRSTLAEEIGSVRRVRLHRRIAQAIEAKWPEATDEDIDLLAYHYGEAAADGDVTKASEYARRAANAAIFRSAYDEANAYLERGLDVVALGASDTRALRADLLIARADLLNRTIPRLDAMRAVGMEAITLAREVQSPVLFARAVYAWAGPASGSLDEQVVSLVTEALAWLGDADPSLRIKLRSTELFHRAFASRLLPGHIEETVALVEAARIIGDWQTLGSALSARASVLKGHPDLSLQRRVSDELTELALAHHDHYFLMASYENHLPLDLGVADRPAFLRHLDEFARLRAELHNRPSESWEHVGAITDALACGRFAEAEDGIQRLVHARDMDDIRTGQLLWLRAEQGRLNELAETLDFLELIADTYSVVLPMLAFARARLGRTDLARNSLRTAAADDFAKLGRDWSWPVSLAMLTEASTIAGDGTFDTGLLKELEPYQGQLLVLSEGVLCIGAADRYLALLNAAGGRTDEALTKFATAYELEARYPSPPNMARTRYWHAKTLLGGNADNGTEANVLLSECIDIGNSLGMTDLVKDAVSLRASD